MSHLKGFNCSKCGRISTAKKLGHNLQRFIHDSTLAHDDRYDYSQVEYVNALSNVIIICRDHGPFSQKLANHIRGIGCPKCGDESTAEKRRGTTEDFILEARKGLFAIQK
ncbi:MAG: hypothetical protein CMF45_03270 [Legionellales bacterium]|nr:hypothetical protein [Legionellales bacterium]|tara:strand:+ start:1985 stop:2314 length:330 start_codon:yes stop_codon:yes gene_type:complete